MGTPREQPTSRLRSQAILAYAVGLAVGLELGLMQGFLTMSLRPLVVFSVGGVLFSSVTLALWQLLFPRLRHLPHRRRMLLQAAIAALCMSVTSFVLVYAETRLYHEEALLAAARESGDVLVTVPAEMIAVAPLVYFLLPILPAAFLAVVGFNQSWWQIFLLERREHQARELAASAQLDALRAQINPHFLFNSLNSIAQLISSDPERAEACVERLAEIFRYLLRGHNRAFVTLAEELEIADAYLDIERARFGDRLEVDFEVAPETRGRQVPTLTLQPLIENAVRHGVSPKVEGGRVSVVADLDGDDLRVEIRDTGVGIAGGAADALSSGIGLRNVHDRLVQLYGARYAPEIQTRPGEGTIVTVRVPKEPASRAETRTEATRPR